jgi:hypothetical protein
MSSTVVAACDGPKALLASSVPLYQKNVWKHQQELQTAINYTAFTRICYLQSAALLSSHLAQQYGFSSKSKKG